MRSVGAYSPQGAVKEYMRRYRTKKGDYISVKPRGHGAWRDYRVT